MILVELIIPIGLGLLVFWLTQRRRIDRGSAAFWRFALIWIPGAAVIIILARTIWH